MLSQNIQLELFDDSSFSLNNIEVLQLAPQDMNSLKQEDSLNIETKAEPIVTT